MLILAILVLGLAAGWAANLLVGRGEEVNGAQLLAIGIAGSSAYGSSREQRLIPGQSMKLAGYTLTYRRIVHPYNPNAYETRAVLDVTGRWSGTIMSGDNQYRNPPEPSREVGIKNRGPIACI